MISLFPKISRPACNKIYPVVINKVSVEAKNAWNETTKKFDAPEQNIKICIDANRADTQDKILLEVGLGAIDSDLLSSMGNYLRKNDSDAVQGLLNACGLDLAAFSEVDETGKSKLEYYQAVFSKYEFKGRTMSFVRGYEIYEEENVLSLLGQSEKTKKVCTKYFFGSDAMDYLDRYNSLSETEKAFISEHSMLK